MQQQLSLRLEKKVDMAAVKKFYDDFVCRDGVTILRLMEINTEDTAGEILLNLWKDYNDALKFEQKQQEGKKAAKSVISPPFTIDQSDNNTPYSNGLTSCVQHQQPRNV